MTLPTDNGHAAPPVESRAVNLTTLTVSEPGEVSRVESN